MGHQAKPKPKSRSTLGWGDLTPQMTVLGLVVQQEDTVSGVKRRLAEQFASAHFSRSTVHNNLRSLAEKGFLRLVEKGPAGQRGFDRYGATPEGVAYFREWFGRLDRLPRIRDVLRAKLQFGDAEDLEARIEEVRKGIEAHRRLGDGAHSQWVRERRVLRHESARGKLLDHGAVLASIQRKDEARLLHGMADRLEGLRDDLEMLLHGRLPEERDGDG